MSVQMEPVGQGVLDAVVAEIKDWLRIATSGEDAALARLAAAAIGHAEAYCNAILIVRAGVEVVAACGQWVRLEATPVRSVGLVRGMPASGTGFDLAVGAYDVDQDASGDAFVRTRDPGTAVRLEIALTAGMAQGWGDLPDALGQGIVRLAAHLFSERESDAPPAIVSALWRPWRRMRLI